MTSGGSATVTDEMTAVETRNADSSAGVVFVCEHASNHIPERYGGLGLDAATLESHVAWDPGALPVALSLAGHFQAPLVAARVSRLLHDCNRPPEAEDAVPAKSELFEIPGNRGLSGEERRARITGIYEPFHATLSTLLDARKAAGLATALVTVHSFTPTYFGRPREVELGVLHDEDSRLADLLLDQAAALTGFKAARNDPYGPEDGVTHTLKRHGLARGLPNVMLEIRNDLLRGAEAQSAAAAKLARLLEATLPILAQTLAEDRPRRAGELR